MKKTSNYQPINNITSAVRDTRLIEAAVSTVKSHLPHISEEALNAYTPYFLVSAYLAYHGIRNPDHLNLFFGSGYHEGCGGHPELKDYDPRQLGAGTVFKIISDAGARYGESLAALQKYGVA